MCEKTEVIARSLSVEKVRRGVTERERASSPTYSRELCRRRTCKVRDYPIKTLSMLAHIRLATYGSVCLENVHPFSRELWGVSPPESLGCVLFPPRQYPETHTHL